MCLCMEGSRRDFLVSSLGAAWLSANMPAILAAQEHAQHAVHSAQPPKLVFFSAAQAAEIEAMAAQIIPTDSTPGAREAGVIYFIDRALTTFERDKQNLYAQGVKDMQAKGFSRMDTAKQIQTLKEIETTDFFNIVRTHTVMGFFANPEHGGNRDEAGWKLIGFEDAHSFDPPFGYYDKV